MKLSPGFLHFCETAVVVVDVGVSAGAVGLVDDATVVGNVPRSKVVVLS